MRLQQLMERQFHIYGRRNRIYFLSVFERINFLSIGIGDVQDGIRKGGDPEKIAGALARVVSRIFCIVEYFKELPFIMMMALKYPLSHCSYCHELPCGCSERRANSRPTDVVETAQLEWSLNDWCAGFARLYGEVNKKRGGQYLLNRLFKEVVELTSLQSRIPEMEEPLEVIEREIALELADALAWTVAVANFLEVDLEAAFEKKYGKGCSKCRTTEELTECTCRRHKKEQLEW